MSNAEERNNKWQMSNGGQSCLVRKGQGSGDRREYRMSK